MEGRGTVTCAISLSRVERLSKPDAYRDGVWWMEGGRWIVQGQANRMSSQITQACNEEAEAYLVAVVEFRQSMAKDLKRKSQSSAPRAVISHPIDLSPTSPAATEPDEAPLAAAPLAAQPALASATDAGASGSVSGPSLGMEAGILQASVAASASGPSLFSLR